MSDDADLLHCRTCDHAHEEIGVDGLAFCREGVTAPLSLQRKAVGNALPSPRDEFVTAGFGCVLHSDLQNRETDG
jgi:hypothetical protein